MIFLVIFISNRQVNSQQYTQMLEDLFIFFATSQSKSLFKEHLRLLVTSCSHDPVLCLSNFCSDESKSVILLGC